MLCTILSNIIVLYLLSQSLFTSFFFLSLFLYSKLIVLVLFSSSSTPIFKISAMEDYRCILNRKIKGKFRTVSIKDVVCFFFRFCVHLTCSVKFIILMSDSFLYIPLQAYGEVDINLAREFDHELGTLWTLVDANGNRHTVRYEPTKGVWWMHFLLYFYVSRTCQGILMIFDDFHRKSCL